MLVLEGESLGTARFIQCLWTLNSPCCRGRVLLRQWFINIHMREVCSPRILEGFSFKLYKALAGLCVCVCVCVCVWLCVWLCTCTCVCVCVDKHACVCAWGHNNSVLWNWMKGPCLSLMLHFHRKWSIRSKSVSGGFRNMIIHAAKRMSLLRDYARQFRAEALL